MCVEMFMCDQTVHSKPVPLLPNDVIVNSSPTPSLVYGRAYKNVILIVFQQMVLLTRDYCCFPQNIK